MSAAVCEIGMPDVYRCDKGTIPFIELSIERDRLTDSRNEAHHGFVLGHATDRNAKAADRKAEGDNKAHRNHLRGWHVRKRRSEDCMHPQDPRMQSTCSLHPLRKS